MIGILAFIVIVALLLALIIWFYHDPTRCPHCEAGTLWEDQRGGGNILYYCDTCGKHVWGKTWWGREL